MQKKFILQINLAVHNISEASTASFLFIKITLRSNKRKRYSNPRE